MRYFSILIFLATFIIYLPWLSLTETLSSGDWPYLFIDNIRSFKLITTDAPFIWLEPYYQLTAKIGVEFFSLSWEVTERIFWFYPFLIISIYTSWKFTKFLLGKLSIKENLNFYAAMGSFFYTTNTYILMIVGGGQMGIAMAYSLAPLVLKNLISLIDFSFPSSKNIKYAMVVGLILGVQLMFDPRIFLITLFGFFIYILFTWSFNKDIDFTKIRNIALVLLLAAVLNLFWIVPNIAFFQDAYTQAAIAANVEFLSFATFSNILSLLHPNWPENIFGKTYFMRSEFIVLPILAYSSLLFISKIKNQISKIHIKNQKYYSSSDPSVDGELRSSRQDGYRTVTRQAGTIIYFCLLGLVGTFLAKGINPPFGELYLWLSNIPGATLFRDPTKFYLLVALSYSVLIPFSVHSVYKWLKLKVTRSVILNSVQDPETSSGQRLRSRNPFDKLRILSLPKDKFGMTISLLFLLFTILYLIFLIRPAILGQLGGTFKPEVVPYEYINFKNFLTSQSEFSYVLWVPTRQRFGVTLENHPTLNAQDIILSGPILDLLGEFKKEGTKKIINDLEIAYVVVPYDSKEEIFLTDRKYDEGIYKKTVKELEKVFWLKRIGVDKDKSFGKIAVFEVLD